MMGVLNRKEQHDAGERVQRAREQVDLALLKMDKTLKSAYQQTLRAKEELREHGAG